MRHGLVYGKLVLTVSYIVVQFRIFICLLLKTDTAFLFALITVNF